MAFLYINRDKDNLSVREMIIDVLATEAKIIHDLKEIFTCCDIKILDHSEKGIILTFQKACLSNFLDRDKSLINLDSEMGIAFEKYRHFPEQFADYIFNEPEANTCLRIKEKYREYSKSINDFYDFFMLPLNKKLQLLNPKNQISTKS